MPKVDDPSKSWILGTVVIGYADYDIRLPRYIDKPSPAITSRPFLIPAVRSAMTLCCNVRERQLVRYICVYGPTERCSPDSFSCKRGQGTYKVFAPMGKYEKFPSARVHPSEAQSEGQGLGSGQWQRRSDRPIHYSRTSCVSRRKHCHALQVPRPFLPRGAAEDEERVEGRYIVS